MASNEDVLKQLLAGKLKMHELDEKVPPQESVELRRKFVEEKTKTELRSMSSFSFDISAVSSRNTENIIGAVHVPVGIAGPIKISGEFAKGEFYIPLATTEGALVASINRGCRAISESGGTTAVILSNKMARAPVFKSSGIKHSREISGWVKSHFDELKKVAASTTKFGELTGEKTWIVGKNVYVRFEFDTKDAMGMNMVTIASEEMAKLIEKETKAKCISVSGNMCIDKKPSALNLIEGRGKTVLAEAVIKRDTVQNVLKTTPEDIVELNYRKNLVGSALAGSLGFNAHFANIIAAAFIATGQDPAHIADGSVGITTAELDGKNLYISVYIPSLNVGTVGGGTGLATQKEALSIMGCAGATSRPGENSKKFAEIIASAVLAGELSVLAAQASGQMTRAHIALGRGKKDGK
ncbi:3-hydroxy-3-methylglutaryl-coenzyme A reductase [uncultured archaeon]|nr:3-hydroxy-3-methylglutaryl-coenzyme A reductase [uncultured archaeon]